LPRTLPTAIESQGRGEPEEKIGCKESLYFVTIHTG